MAYTILYEKINSFISKCNGLGAAGVCGFKALCRSAERRVEKFTVLFCKDGNYGKWTQVKSGSSTGWIASSSLTKKKITASSSKANASAKEISLAGKGFTQEIENSYKNSSGTDYASVDKIETITVLHG